MKLLLTGFDPFGGETVNPSWEAAKLVPAALGDVEIVKLPVPTAFAGAASVLEEALRRERPHAVLCLGQAGGRTGLTPERVAINVDDARIPDNDGYQPVDVPIVPDGPAAYFATLPVKAMVAAVREAGLPASLSNSAGTFVCNHLMYCLLHMLKTEYPGTRGGFMHVPYLPEQVSDKPGQPFMALGDIVRGIQAAIGAIFAG